jgi:hypothetical protein
MLFIDGRFSRDPTVTPNVGHSCRRSYQRYADLLVGRHPASTSVLSIPERQKSTHSGRTRQHTDWLINSGSGQLPEACYL